MGANQSQTDLVNILIKPPKPMATAIRAALAAGVGIGWLVRSVWVKVENGLIKKPQN
jgi:hypothetical protein